MKKLTILILSGILASSISSSAIANPTNKALFQINNNKYTINDNQQTMDGVPFVSNGRAYLPIRYLAYACGLVDNGIKWDQNSGTIALVNENTNISLTLGSVRLNVSGNYTSMDVTPLDVNGRIYIPARWIAQAYGYDVDWDQTTQTVTIFKENLSPQNNGTVNDSPTFNLPTSIKSVFIAEDSSGMTDWVPNNQSSVLAQVSSWLNTATLYTEEIPQSQVIDTRYAYGGPSQLYLTTLDKKYVKIYPAYEVKIGKTDTEINVVNGVATKTEIPEYQYQYFQDVLVFDNEGNITYIKSEPLYNWLKNDQWKQVCRVPGLNDNN